MGLKTPFLIRIVPAAAALSWTIAGSAQENLDITRIRRAEETELRDTKPFWINHEECIADLITTFIVARDRSADTIRVYSSSVGVDCTGASPSKEDCELVYESEVVADGTGGWRVDIGAQDLVASMVDGDNYTRPGQGDESGCDAGSGLGTSEIELTFVALAGGAQVGNALFKGSNADDNDDGFGYDVKGPTAPTGLTATSGENQLSLEWDAPDDSKLTGYIFYCEPANAAGTMLQALEAGLADVVAGGTGGSAGTTGTGGGAGIAATGGTSSTGGSVSDGGLPRGGSANADAGAPPRTAETECGTTGLVGGQVPPEGALVCGDADSTGASGWADKGLTNGVSYHVAVAAVDQAGNVGPLSKPACGTPEVVDSFYELYRRAGGPGGGGFCAAAPGARATSGLIFGLVVAALGLVRARRRRKRDRSAAGRRLAGSAGLAASLASQSYAPPALAQGFDEFGTYGPPVTERESPQYFAGELRFGPYNPNVDDGVSGGAPFEDVFGDGNRYFIGLEFDWQALRIPKVGTLGPGFGLAFTRASGKGLTADGRRSGQESVLTIIPMYVVGVFRLDVLAREAEIPLVPYGKAGLGLAPWWSTDGNETARDDDGTVARDWSYGYQVAAGGMFLLDWLEPSAAANMDSNTGVNNAYVFGEFYLSSLDGFGSGDQMQVGTMTWVVGLAAEF
jgi:hypothetical protein